MEDRMHRYVIGFDRYLVDSCMAMASQVGMDIGRLQAYVQGMEDRHRGDHSGIDRDRRPPKRSRLARRLDGVGPSGVDQSSRASGPQTSRGSGQSRPLIPRCSYCGRSHLGECYRATGACFSCGCQGHIMRDCPLASDIGGAVQPTGSAAGLSSTPPAALSMG
ncbi:uncharacterized protein LOC129875601 [Solanum dulcamara]|uniref:uncharacterized protein LOC129875601 n=1 Tax=Solanum dulcamara TaxID=45834 RepID=UPI00248504A0|nr:uncharacterized protein LOC129875601 [Solanum dulcamara]